jgi:hypothetical protein
VLLDPARAARARPRDGALTQTLELGLAAHVFPVSHRLIAAQDETLARMLHLVQLGIKEIRLQHAFLEERPHLGIGQRRDVFPALGRERLLGLIMPRSPTKTTSSTPQGLREPKRSANCFNANRNPKTWPLTGSPPRPSNFPFSARRSASIRCGSQPVKFANVSVRTLPPSRNTLWARKSDSYKLSTTPPRRARSPGRMFLNFRG